MLALSPQLVQHNGISGINSGLKSVPTKQEPVDSINDRKKIESAAKSDYVVSSQFLAKQQERA